ncbi:hypothetical protein ISP15_13450 [Dyella jejuensis]|uniref:Uncharacterized protein n=1 Tax=Dyella jejuensis TaxID=1432009 RepID=A0ABW8JNA7_9GAMM
MVPQYVFPSSRGLFRIVRHGHRWRSLVEANEVARHDSAQQALDALRQAWPRARLPQALGEWRYLPEPGDRAHARLARATHVSRMAGFDPSPAHVRRSRRSQGRTGRGVPEHGDRSPWL